MMYRVEEEVQDGDYRSWELSAEVDADSPQEAIAKVSVPGVKFRAIPLICECESKSNAGYRRDGWIVCARCDGQVRG